MVDYRVKRVLEVMSLKDKERLLGMRVESIRRKKLSFDSLGGRDVMVTYAKIGGKWYRVELDE